MITLDPAEVANFVPLQYVQQVLVSFGQEFTGLDLVEGVQVATGMSSWRCICPPAKPFTPDGTAGIGKKQGRVLLTSGKVLGTFVFTYVAQPAVLSPSFALVTGGFVTLQTFFSVRPNTDLATCSVQFGSSNPSITTILSSTGAPTPVSVTFSAQVARVSAPMVVGCMLICNGAIVSNLGGSTLRYINPPKVTTAIESDGCTSIDCKMLISIRDPPPWYTGAESFVVLAESSGRRVQGFSMSDTRRHDNLSLIVSAIFIIPGQFLSFRIAMSQAGRANPFVTLSILHSYSPFGVDGSLFSLYVNTTLATPTPRLIRLLPRTARSGDQINAVIKSVIPSLDPKDFEVIIGNRSIASLRILSSDLEETRIVFTMPEMDSGTGLFPLIISRLTKHGNASSISSFGYVDSHQTAVCLYNCRVQCSGNVVMGFRLVGFKTDFISTIQASISDIPAIVTRVSVESEETVIVHVLAPAWNATEVYATTLLSDSAFLMFQTAEGTTLASFEYVLAPRVISIQFNSIGSRISIEFNTETNGFGKLPCSDVIEDTAPLGLGHSCMWLDSARLTIILGIEAIIMPGNNITFIGSNIQTLDSTSDPADVPAVLEVMPPIMPEAPILKIEGATVIGMCDSANFTAMASTARPLRYTWGCSNDAQTNHLLSTQTGYKISLKANVLAPGRTYSIWVQAETFLGGISAKVYTSIFVAALPPPLISMVLPAAPIRSQSELMFTAYATLSSCSITSSDVQFKWAIYTSQTDIRSEPTTVFTTTGPSMNLPAGTVFARRAYNVTLSVTQDGTLPIVLEKSFYVQPSALIARIAGGSRLISRKETALQLDASESRDPDICNLLPCKPDQLQFRYVATTFQLFAFESLFKGTCVRKSMKDLLTVATCNQWQSIQSKYVACIFFSRWICLLPDGSDCLDYESKLPIAMGASSQVRSRRTVVKCIFFLH